MLSVWLGLFLLKVINATENSRFSEREAKGHVEGEWIRCR